jgi:glycosidase
LREKFIIYQVLPRLFGNTNGHCIPNAPYTINGSGKLSAFDRNVIRSIKELGCNYIWLTGIIEHATGTSFAEHGIKGDNPHIVKGEAGSPYAIKDYYDISPDLADNPLTRMDEFRQLITRAKKEDTGIIIDFVPNHLSRCYYSDSKPAHIEDFGHRDRSDCAFLPENDYYYIPGKQFVPPVIYSQPGREYVEYPAKVTGNDCFRPDPLLTDWYDTVKLNYGIDYQDSGKSCFTPVPDTWKKMTDILLFWSNEGVSGFRCDMAGMVPEEFWNMAISAVKEKFPDVMFIAEIYEPERYRRFLEAGFDYLYDKTGLYDTLRSILKGEMPACSITGCWQALGDIRDRMLNFLENHDEQRIASDFFLGDATLAIPALAVSSLMSRSPFMIYFGQELGEKGMDSEGFSGKDGRTSIFDYWSLQSIRDWLSGNGEPSLRNTYKKIQNLAIRENAFSKGELYDLEYANLDNEKYNPQYHFSFLRGYESEIILVVVNFSENESVIKVNIPKEAFVFYKSNKYEVVKGEDLLSDYTADINIPSECAHLSVPEHGVRIIKFSL